MICCIVAAWAISLMQKPAAEGNPNSEAYVYEPKGNTVSDGTESVGNASIVTESGSSTEGAQTYTVIEPQSMIADKHQDMVEQKGSIPITHTEWLAKESDLDVIYREVESYAQTNSINITEMELLDYNDITKQYEVEIYPSEAVLEVKVD